jgi:TRAP-type uncharacterized transport system substrate-binding protein
MTVVVPGGAQTPAYAATVGWSNLMAADTGMKTALIAESTQVAAMKILRDGKANVAATAATQGQWMATANYATRDGGAWQIRLLYPSSVADAGYMVPKNSSIKTPYDIKPGAKIIYVTLDPNLKKAMDALLAWGKIDPNSVTFVPVNSMEAACRAIIEGRGDVSWMSTTWPSAYEVEASPGGMAWVALDAKADPAAAERWYNTYSFGAFGVMSTGVPSAKGVPSVVGISADAVRQDVDPQLVYKMVEWLDLNYGRYKDSHAWCAGMTLGNLLKLSETQWQPIHEGAILYLKAKGLWTDKHQARWQANVDLIGTWEKAYQDAIKQADQKGISVTPENKAWLDFWLSYQQDKNLKTIMNFRGL